MEAMVKIVTGTRVQKKRARAAAGLREGVGVSGGREGGGGGDVRGRYQLCRSRRRKAQVNRIPSSDVADDEAESNGERRRRRRKRGDQNVQG
jgi:hypothetical protein